MSADNIENLIYGGEFSLNKYKIKQRKKSLFPKNFTFTLSGRAALYLIISYLKKKGVKKALIPYLICKSIRLVLKKEGIKIIYYDINKNFEPIINKEFRGSNIMILINHYFGLRCKSLKKIENIKKQSSYIIEDLSHLYLKKNIFNNKNFKFASLRKTGIFPIGGWANIQSNENKTKNFKKYLIKKKIIDYKFKKFMYLKKKTHTRNIEFERKNLKLLDKYEQILSKDYKYHILNDFSSINYLPYNINKTLLQREKNWKIANKNLSKFSKKVFSSKNLLFKFSYIIFCNKRDLLRKRLVKNDIFCPVYWKLSYKLPKTSFSRYCSENILSIPIDQRYNETKVKLISEKVKKIVKNIR